MVNQALLAILIIFFIMQNASAEIRYDGGFNVLTGQEAFNNSFCGGCDANICQENIDYIANTENAGRFNLTKQPIINNPYGIDQI